MALASSRFFLPVTRGLLQLQPGERPTALFARLGIPKSPGYRVVAFYEAHGAVASTPEGLQVDSRQVLRLAGGLRADRALPDRAIVKGPPLKQALALLTHDAIQHSLAFQSAANHISYFEPGGNHALYLELTTKGNANDNQPDLGNIVNSFTRHRNASREHCYDFFVEDFRRLDLRHDDGFTYTSLVQTLLDLSTHSRMAASQEFLFDLLTKGVRR